jgi:hypothetical protein
LDCFDAANLSRQLIPAATRPYPVLYFSWDPGIMTQLSFYGFFAQAATQGGILVEASAYCYRRSMATFLTQNLFSHVYYINLVQVHLDRKYDVSHRYHLNFGKTKGIHAPWDPGG